MHDNPFEYAHLRDDIVWMSQNTNHLPVAPEIEESIAEAVRRHDYNKYPLNTGVPGLTDLIRQDLGLPNHDVLITNGCIEALYILNRALLAPGDEVICTDPSFQPIHAQMQMAGAVPIELPVYQEPWKMTVEQAQEAINPKTKMLLLIDPLNPLGSGYSRDEVRALAQLADDHDLWFVDDVTYRDFSYDHTMATDFYPDKTLVPISFSKNLGFAGLRLGALIAPPDVMKQCKVMDTNVLSANILAQTGAKAALETRMDPANTWFDDMLKQSRRNQQLIKETVMETEGVFIPVYPSNTNTMVVDIGGTGKDPMELQQDLLYEHQVFIRGGNYLSKKFGSTFIRISFTVPEEGVMRFRKAWQSVMG